MQQGEWVKGENRVKLHIYHIASEWRNRLEGPINLLYLIQDHFWFTYWWNPIVEKDSRLSYERNYENIV